MSSYNDRELARKRLERYIEIERKKLERQQTTATENLPVYLTEDQLREYHKLLIETENRREIYSSLLDLPELSGPARQRLWAYDIRDEFLLFALQVGISPAALKSSLNGLRSCRWWIDHRFVLGLVPVLHFLNHFKEKEGNENLYQ